MPRLLLIVALIALIGYGLWTVIKVPLYKYRRKRQQQEKSALENFEKDMEKTKKK